MFLTGFTSPGVLLLFPLSRFCQSTNLLMRLSLETNIHHKDCLTYSVGTDRSGEPCYNFSISNNVTHMLTFLLRSQTVILKALFFWISFFLPTLVFVLQWFSLLWEILTLLLSQFSLTFHQIHNRMPKFIA